jgi:hypothetical protein
MTIKGKLRSTDTGIKLASDRGSNKYSNMRNSEDKNQGEQE